ncbi:MAG: copper resistance protein CopC [Acetobacteraceae bacterium]|nr:copper resistance protein CopC [Acetobacteraceae bacterium]
MQKISRRTLAISVGVAMLLPLTRKAEAHAILLESTPAIDGSVPVGPNTVHLRYNSRIDRARSRLILTRPDKSTEILPIAIAGGDDVLTSQIDLAAGRYNIRWQVLAVDGHITRGDIPFTVEGR